MPEVEAQTKAKRRFVLTPVLLFILLFGLLAGAMCWLLYSLVGRGFDMAHIVFETWRDDDRDGVWDAGEIGVAYVPISVSDLTDGYTDLSVATDLEGRTSIVFEPLGADHTYEIIPVVPPGYELTTPERLERTTSELSDARIGFGLALLPGQPTPTPRPVITLACSRIFESDKGNGTLKGMLPGPDGSIVLALQDEDELRQFAADGMPLPSIPAPPGEYYRLLFAPDGRAWAWGGRIDDGLVVLDGGKWVYVAPYEYPGPHPIYTMAVTSEGVVWLGTTVGALRRDPATGEWSRFAADEGVTSVIPTDNGVVWLLTVWDNPWKLLPSGTPGHFAEQNQYPQPSLEGTSHGTFWEEPGLWIVTESGLAQWVDESQTWVIYDHDTTDNALPPARILDYTRMADGSLWLAMTDQLLHARPEENQWVLASLPESVVGMVEYIEAAADDSLWLQTQNPSAVYRCTP